VRWLFQAVNRRLETTPHRYNTFPAYFYST
jgi:hypothetical protein